MHFILPFLASLASAAVIAPALPSIPADFDLENEEIVSVPGEYFNITTEEFGDTLGLAVGIEEPDLEVSPSLGVETATNVYSTLKFGKNYIDWGCGASIRKTIDLALRALCDEAGCDSGDGATYARKVQWTKGSMPDNISLVVRVQATFPNSSVNKNLRESLIEAVRPDSTKNKVIPWSWRQPGGWEVTGKCNMSRFPNYLHIARFQSGTGNQRGELRVWVTVKKPTTLSEIGKTALGIIGSAVTRKIGNWGGKVNAKMQ